MSTSNDLDKDLARLLAQADRGGAPRPDTGTQPAAAATPATPPVPRLTITPSDPAVQILESAHQVVMMIGANPRAIRPILAQRRLTKEAILDAAASVAERVATALTDLEAAETERTAAQETATAQIRAQMEAEEADAAQVTDQEAAILAECNALRERIGRIQTRFGITELPRLTPEPAEEEEKHGLFSRLIDELTDNRVVGAFVRVRRGDVADAAQPDGRVLRPEDAAIVTVQNMDEFVQATDPALPQAELYKMWCDLSSTTDADVRTALATAQEIVARQVTQSTEVQRQNDEAHRAEMARLQGQVDGANAAFTRAQAEHKNQSTYLTGLRDRAAKVGEVYQLL